MNRLMVIAAALALGAVLVGFWRMGQGGGPESVEDDPTVLAAGEALFQRNCAVCHGAAAAGSDKGPPLVHKIYEPSHHGDQSFYLAVQNGTRAHHWRFGNMPAIPALTTQEVEPIIAYVRALQRADGIY